MKTCSKCGELQPLSEYYKQKDCKDGHRPDCKTCVKARSIAWRQENLERQREYDRRRYVEHPGRAEAARLTARKYYANNRDHGLATRRAYYLANPEVFERGRAKRNALKREVEHQPYTRREIYDRDGGVCRGCHKNLTYGPGGFHIDHIVPLTLSGPDTPANVQLMCPACNREKWATLKGQIHFAV